MRYNLIIFILFFNISVFGYNIDGIKNVCDFWLDNVPMGFKISVWLDPTPDPNDNVAWIQNYYNTILSTNHIEGGYGINFRDPNNRKVWVTFHRFDWVEEDMKIVTDMVDFSVWIDPTSDPNDNVQWLMEDYYLHPIEGDEDIHHPGNKVISFKDAMNRNMIIVFYEIKWEPVNLIMYTQAVRGN